MIIVYIKNNVLATLKLSRNHLSDVGVDLITDALWDNKGLLYLDVSHNEITNNGLLWCSRNLRRSKYLKKIDLRGNLFMKKRNNHVKKYWSETYDPFEVREKEKGEEKEKEKKKEEGEGEEGGEEEDETNNKQQQQSKHLINHRMRSNVVVQTVRGDDRRLPSLVVQSVLGCIIGAVERYKDADVPGNNVPAAQMTLGHFYNIALEEVKKIIYYFHKQIISVDSISILFHERLYFDTYYLFFFLISFVFGFKYSFFFLREMIICLLLVIQILF